MYFLAAEGAIKASIDNLTNWEGVYMCVGEIITSSNLMGDVRCLTVSLHRAQQCS